MAEARRFGLAGLDRMVAPPPPGATLLIANDPGIEAEPFLYEFAKNHIGDGRPVVYVVTNRSPGSVVASMEAYGLGAGRAARHLKLVDAFSALMGAAEPAAYLVKDPTDLAKLTATLELAASENPGAILVIDSLSTLVDSTSTKTFEAAFPGLERAMRQYALSAALFTRWPYGDAVDAALASFDAVLAVRGVEERVLFGQYFALERARWAPDLARRPQLFKLAKPGGVLVYIPKIVVTGPYSAGKSTFVHTVSDAAVSVDRLGTTVALDHGHVTLDGLTADIFGTPGQSRFDPILKTVAGQALGVIVLVDSTKPESFPRARELMEETWKEGLPAIIGANKQDLPGALAPSEVGRRMGTPAHVRVVGCSGTNREAARKVLRDLLDQITVGSVAV